MDGSTAMSVIVANFLTTDRAVRVTVPQKPSIFEGFGRLSTLNKPFVNYLKPIYDYLCRI